MNTGINYNRNAAMQGAIGGISQATASIMSGLLERRRADQAMQQFNMTHDMQRQMFDHKREMSEVGQVDRQTQMMMAAIGGAPAAGGGGSGGVRGQAQGIAGEMAPGLGQGRNIFGSGDSLSVLAETTKDTDPARALSSSVNATNWLANAGQQLQMFAPDGRTIQQLREDYRQEQGLGEDTLGVDDEMLFQRWVAQQDEGRAVEQGLQAQMLQQQMLEQQHLQQQEAARREILEQRNALLRQLGHDRWITSAEPTVRKAHAIAADLTGHVGPLGGGGVPPANEAPQAPAPAEQTPVAPEERAVVGEAPEERERIQEALGTEIANQIDAELAEIESADLAQGLVDELRETGDLPTSSEQFSAWAEELRERLIAERGLSEATADQLVDLVSEMLEGELQENWEAAEAERRREAAAAGDPNYAAGQRAREQVHGVVQGALNLRGQTNDLVGSVLHDAPRALYDTADQGANFLRGLFGDMSPEERRRQRLLDAQPPRPLIHSPEIEDARRRAIPTR